VTPREAASTVVAAALALSVAYAGVRWGVLVAGGADSYGYVSQAELWRQRHLVVHQDIVRPTPWPRAAETWTPLGYRPSPHARDGYVPLYAPGLPLLMAAAQMIGGFCAAFIVVPLSGALTVWLTFVLGRRMFGSLPVAIGGAALVAASPVFLYQLLNAMSDVPVTACWTLALVLASGRRAFTSGIATAMAIAIRPNLAPLAFVVGAWILLCDGDPAQRRRALIAYAAGVTPALVGIASLNARLYESPFVSGYGTTGDLYAIAYAGRNVVNYARWIAEVETPIVALAVVYVAMPRLSPAPPLSGARVLVGGTIAVTLLSYLFYEPFDVWWYLRFLLPMWPVTMLATAAAIDAIVARRVSMPAPIFLAAIVAVLAWHHLQFARSHGIFELGRTERKYVDVARFVADHTEPEAVVLSHQHSGSLRLYAGRLTLRFDILDPGWLDRAVALLQSAGRHPYLVLDDEERGTFRERFASVSTTGALDWTPVATLNGIVDVYDLATRVNPGPPLAIASTRGSRGGLACEPPYSRPPVR